MNQDQEYSATQTGAKVTGIGCSVIVCLVLVMYFVFEWKNTPGIDLRRKREREAQIEAVRSGKSGVVSLTKEEIDSLPPLDVTGLQRANSPMAVSEDELRKNAIRILLLPDLPKPRPKGTVQVQLIISKQGNVLETKIVNGDADSLLGKAAMETAGQWQFKPFIHSGATVQVVGSLTFGYTSK